MKWKWKMAPLETKVIFQAPIFHFHDDGRKGSRKQLHQLPYSKATAHPHVGYSIAGWHDWIRCALGWVIFTQQNIWNGPILARKPTGFDNFKT